MLEKWIGRVVRVDYSVVGWEFMFMLVFTLIFTPTPTVTLTLYCIAKRSWYLKIFTGWQPYTQTARRLKAQTEYKCTNKHVCRLPLTARTWDISHTIQPCSYASTVLFRRNSRSSQAVAPDRRKKNKITSSPPHAPTACRIARDRPCHRRFPEGTHREHVTR